MQEPNHDDPDSTHLFFDAGDGRILTFFVGDRTSDPRPIRPTPGSASRRGRRPTVSYRTDTSHTPMTATFELYRDSADEWRWRLRHSNGNVVADSGEGYASKAKAKQGIRSVKSNAPDAEIEEV
ncbi:YegP family protein [Halomicroarcula sp. F27]|uniref:YegP family protein n=2 Tax=Haloarcula nitratireducens TaxID=2487749 RepID=A0AAW4PAG5_9EURY|nr:YegP family protein [Halomicroarcula nitratireducens]